MLTSGIGVCVCERCVPFTFSCLAVGPWCPVVPATTVFFTWAVTPKLLCGPALQQVLCSHLQRTPTGLFAADTQELATLSVRGALYPVTKLTSYEVAVFRRMAPVETVLSEPPSTFR